MKNLYIHFLKKSIITLTVLAFFFSLIISCNDNSTPTPSTTPSNSIVINGQLSKPINYTYLVLDYSDPLNSNLIKNGFIIVFSDVPAKNFGDSKAYIRSDVTYTLSLTHLEPTEDVNSESEVCIVTLPQNTYTLKNGTKLYYPITSVPTIATAGGQNYGEPIGTKTSFSMTGGTVNWNNKTIDLSSRTGSFDNLTFSIIDDNGQTTVGQFTGNFQILTSNF